MRMTWFWAVVPAISLNVLSVGFAQSSQAQETHNRTDPGSAADLVDLTISPADRDLLPSIMRALNEADPSIGVTKLDALIPRLSESPLKVILKSQRAARQVSSGEVHAGREEFEKLIDRFPQVVGIKIQAIDSLAYGHAAEFAARQWGDLAASNPQAAKNISGYTMGALAENLDAQGASDAKLALFLALDRIGYDPKSATLRNNMQFAIFTNAAIDTGREEQAIAALEKLTDPRLLLNVAAQSRFRGFWPHIELDAASLNARGATFLRELEADFLAADNGPSAGQFLTTAAAIGDPNVVASTYSELLSKVLARSENNKYAQYDTPFWGAPIASAWMAAGAPRRAEQQFESVLGQYAAISGVNDLNISANYAKLLLELDRPREALAMIEPAIAELKSIGQSTEALAHMHAVRLGAYHSLGQAAEARDSRRHLERVRSSLLGVYVQTMLIIGDMDAARNAVIGGLRSLDPEDAIQVLQYPLARPNSPASAQYEGELEKLRQDREVVAALTKVGRLVPVEPIEAGAFDHSATAEKFPL